jgi:RecA-family ATPase
MINNIIVDNEKNSLRCNNLDLRLCSNFINEVNSMPKVNDIIDGLLPRNQTMLIIGDPWEGKSILAQNLSLLFGAGSNFYGLKLHKCRALYITWEGSRVGIKNRFEIMSNAIKPDLEPLLLKRDVPLRITTEQGYKDMSQIIQAAKDEYGIDVLILDSFPYTFDGNITDDKSMGVWLETINRLNAELDITSIVVWEVTKRNIDIPQFDIQRVKGAGAASYRTGAIVAIGDSKKVMRVDGKIERVSQGHRIVVIKSKETGNFDKLNVSMDIKTFSYIGQSWEYDTSSGRYIAVGGK